MNRHNFSISDHRLWASIVRLILSLTLLYSVLSSSVAGQSAMVTFEVDLRFAPLDAGEVVVLRGSSATLGRWEGGDLQLSPSVGTRHGITVLFPDRDLGQVHAYKFAILDGDNVRWESRSSRSFLLTAGHQTLDVVFFDDMDRPVLTADLPVQFTLDMNAFNAEPPTGIGIAGEQWPLGSLAPSQLVLMQQQNNLWTANVIFEAGTPADISFRFFLEIDGRWQEELGARRHAVILNNNRASRTIEMVYNGRMIVPASHARELLIDDYDGIIAATGAGGNRYLLDAALLQLEAGNLNRANTLFQLFESSYLPSAPDREHLQDLYPIRYGQHLYATGQTTLAESFFHDKENNVETSERKAAYALALATARLSAKDYDGAILAFDSIEQLYYEVSDSREAAALGKGIAYLAAGQYSAGTQWLEGLELIEKRQRAAHNMLGQAYTDSSDYPAAIAAFEALTNFGTDAEQIKARLQALEVKYRAGSFNDALVQIESMLSAENRADEKEGRLQRAAKNHYRTAHLLYLKALILDSQGQDATDLFAQVITRYADTRYARRALHRPGN